METELIEKPTTELTMIDRAALALSSDKTRQELAELVTKSANIVEIKDKAGREECHARYMALVKARTAIAATGKAARDDATKFSKAVIQEEAALIAITKPEEERLQALRNAWDAIIAAENAAREAAERARITAIHERISGIKEYVALAAECRTSTRIQALQDKLASMVMEGFDEFSEEANAAWQEAGKRVEAILAAKLEEEAEREAAKQAQAAEAARLKAEREAFEAQQAAAKAEADAQAAAFAAQQAAAQAELDKQRAAMEAEQEAARKIVAEHQAKAEAAAQAEREAAAKLAAEQAAAQQEAEFEAQRAAMVQAIETPPAEQAPQADDEPIAPSDSEVIWSAISALCHSFQMTQEQALARLAAIEDWTL